MESKSKAEPDLRPDPELQDAFYAGPEDHVPAKTPQKKLPVEEEATPSAALTPAPRKEFAEKVEAAPVARLKTKDLAEGIKLPHKDALTTPLQKKAAVEGEASPRLQVTKAAEQTDGDVLATPPQKKLAV